MRDPRALIAGIFFVIVLIGSISLAENLGDWILGTYYSPEQEKTITECDAIIEEHLGEISDKMRLTLRLMLVQARQQAYRELQNDE